MSRVQMKRRKKREKGSASVRSLICAFSGLAGIIFLVYAVYEAAVKEQMPRMVTGLAMIFFFCGLIWNTFSEDSRAFSFIKGLGYTSSSCFIGRVYGDVLSRALQSSLIGSMGFIEFPFYKQAEKERITNGTGRYCNGK